MDNETSEFFMDFLFLSISNDDHEDAMNELLYILTDDGDEVAYQDIVFASMFAGAYHHPTSRELDSLNYIRRQLAMEELNG